MRAGWLHGVFLVWRNGTDKETIYDWGVFQLNEKGELDAHLLSYKPEIICEARVPIFTSKDPKAILQCDIDAAIEVVNADLVEQVKSRPDLQRIREQFGRLVHLYGPKGKPKPPVEIIDAHDWNLLWKNATVF
jgi:hypothetical protein